jgi:two-component sensor histidine kinase
MELARLRAAVKSADSLGDKELRLVRMRQLRDLQARYGALDSAMATGMQLVDLGVADQDRFTLAADWQALARLSHEAGNLPDAIASIKRAILILKTTGIDKFTRSATLELLDLLLEARKMDEFKHLSETELLACQQADDLEGQVLVRCRQGIGLILQGRPEDALPVLHLASRDIAFVKDGHDASAVHFALAKAYAALGQWEAARTAFDSGLQLAPAALARQPELYRLRASILEGSGDLKGALACMRAEVSLSDSAFSASRADRMAQIQMMYDVRAKDKELSELRDTARADQARIGAWKAKATGLAILSAILFLAMLVLLLLRFRQRRVVRRARLRNSVIRDKANEMQAKSLELERQNLRLSRALMDEDGKKREPVTEPYTCGVRMLDLVLQAQLDRSRDEEQAAMVTSLRNRAHAMALLNENLAKAAGTGTFNLKAHLHALATSILREHARPECFQPVFDIAADGHDPVHFLPLSMLYGELLRITLEQAGPSPEPFTIHLGLRRLGMNQWEFLYVDGNGGIDARSLNSGAFGPELVKAFARALGGTIVLLRDDVIAFQMTYEGGQQAELRKAS